jgi:ABC-type transport system involved in cytochrome bd biosynthesis fused ATPase/permease subunit
MADEPIARRVFLRHAKRRRVSFGCDDPRYDPIRPARRRSGRGGRCQGQQQRIALAQALLALGDDRKVVVLDEFTSQLDSETEGRILSNLRPWLAGRTVIIIAHRLSTVRDIAGRIVVVEDGEIIEDGSHEELIDRNGWYAKMAQYQGAGIDDRLSSSAVSSR